MQSSYLAALLKEPYPAKGDVKNDIAKVVWSVRLVMSVALALALMGGSLVVDSFGVEVVPGVYAGGTGHGCGSGGDC